MQSRIKDYLIKPGLFIFYNYCYFLKILLSKGFPTDVSFVEVSCVGSKIGFDKLRSLVKEKIDRLGW